MELIRQKLVRESKDFNTVDAYRLLDKHAECEVSNRDVANFLLNEVKIDEHSCNINSVDLLAQETLKYSDFCDIFVPKSQKVLAELTAKKPKNLEGRLSYK